MMTWVSACLTDHLILCYRVEVHYGQQIKKNLRDQKEAGDQMIYKKNNNRSPAVVNGVLLCASCFAQLLQHKNK